MPRSNKVWVATLALVAAVSATKGQEPTIGEYSAAQKQAIADEMAKLRGKAPVAVPAAASAPPVAVVMMRPMAPPPPMVRVAGVSIMQRRSVAEINVNGTAYMLEVGDAVPGTGQTVSYIAEDKVQLATPGRGRKAKPVVATYKLGAMR